MSKRKEARELLDTQAWTAEFDPADIERLFVQDAIFEERGWYPYWPSKPISECDLDQTAEGYIFLVWTPDFDGWYKLDLPTFIADLRNALLLPLCDSLLGWMRDLLVGAEDEQQRLLRVAQRAEIGRRKYGPSSWESADLLAEVESVCGQGRKSGGEYWFRCPFHNDRSPSLELHPEKRVWHCWGCGAAGGVVDWRKRVS